LCRAKGVSGPIWHGMSAADLTAGTYSGHTDSLRHPDNILLKKWDARDANKRRGWMIGARVSA